MKIALIGYGKMGKTIEQIALKRGHQIVLRVDVNNSNEFEAMMLLLVFSIFTARDSFEQASETVQFWLS